MLQGELEQMRRDIDRLITRDDEFHIFPSKEIEFAPQYITASRDCSGAVRDPITAAASLADPFTTNATSVFGFGLLADESDNSALIGPDVMAEGALYVDLISPIPPTPSLLFCNWKKAPELD